MTQASPESPEVTAWKTASATSAGSISGKPALRRRSMASPSSGVSVMPGQMALTRIPLAANNGASERVRPRTACLVMV